MLHCACGYTCGTPAALERHVAKFADDEEGLVSHVRVPAPISPKRPQAREAPVIRIREPSSESLDSPPSPASPESRPVRLPAIQPERANHGPAGGADANSLETVRLVLVRHAQSGNKARADGERASPDPDLSELGFEQAEALGQRMERELKQDLLRAPGSVIVASSPMRRCLYTIQPAVQRLGLAGEDCLCHGACYEFGCAGTRYGGTTPEEIAEDFPEFSPVGFGDNGTWDYRGCNQRETEDEARERAVRVVEWLLLDQAPALRRRSLKADAPRTLILVAHQTLLDLVQQLLVTGTHAKWAYGDITYKICNAAITEIWLEPYNDPAFGTRNDDGHLLHLFGRTPVGRRILSPSPSPTSRYNRSFA